MLDTVVAALIVVSLAPAVVLAHGTHLEASVTRRVTVAYEAEVRAVDHGGQPLAGAQVTVVAPDAPNAAWLVGETDADGRFVFAPDPARPGAWRVTVLRHGHGGTVELTVAAPAADAQPATVRAEATAQPTLSTVQRVTMAACVLWGLAGTALAFLRRRP